MTGFASKTLSLVVNDKNKIHVSISLKSLNSRFFETTCKLPQPISYLETDLIKLLKNSLHRGNIFLIIQMSNAQLLKGSIAPAINIIKNYLNAIEQVKSQLPIQGSLSVAELMRIPDAFITEETEIDSSFETAIVQAVAELIEQLIRVRAEEGLALEKDLRERIAQMGQALAVIEQRTTILMDEQKRKIAQSVAELEKEKTEGTELRKGHLYLLLDKMDIHEEIIRFKAHLESLETQLASQATEKGKRLDFTLQELAREINTMGAKCSDANISSQAINIKVELEKAREQSQNIV